MRSTHWFDVKDLRAELLSKNTNTCTHAHMYTHKRERERERGTEDRRENCLERMYVY